MKRSTRYAVDDLENTMLSERTRHKGHILCKSVYEDSRDGQIQRRKGDLVVV